MELILKNTTTETPSPTSWTEFTDPNTNNKIKIRGGSQAWTWEVETTCPMLKKHQNKIVNTYVMQGMKQHEYKGGYKEATAILKVKI
jgi:hypothetical protein